MFHYKQCTIQWHVDDNKVTQGSEDLIKVVIDVKNTTFGELVVSRKNKHTFLGMDIELAKDEKKIGMQRYIK